MFTLTIETHNAAFGETDSEVAAEIAKIMRHIAGKVEAGADSGRIYDHNGNHVGDYRLTT